MYTHHQGYQTFSHDLRGSVKNSIVENIVREWKIRYPSLYKMFGSKSGYRYNRWSHNQFVNDHYYHVDSIIAAWAGSSSVKILQDAANEIFRLNTKTKDSDNDIIFNDTDFLFHKLIIKLIYELTQEEFKRQGTKYVILQRGMNYEYCHPRSVPSLLSSLKPLSSFTSDLNRIAKRFGIVVYQGSIPVRYIASTYFTGYGCMEELEYVVWGSGKVRKHLKMIKKNNYDLNKIDF